MRVARTGFDRVSGLRQTEDEGRGGPYLFTPSCLIKLSSLLGGLRLDSGILTVIPASLVAGVTITSLDSKVESNCII